MQKSLIVKDSALATMRKDLVVKDKALIVKDKALATKDKNLQKALAELAELKRKFGVN